MLGTRMETRRVGVARSTVGMCRIRVHNRALLGANVTRRAYNPALGARPHQSIATVVENSSREVPAADSRRKLPEDVRVLLRAKNAAMRRASVYPTCENRSCARALQRKVKAWIQEFKNDKWSILMEEITPSHQAYWKLAKALKSDGYLPTPALRKPDNTFAVDDREKAECLADSIEQQCSNNSIHDAAHSHRIEEEVRMKISLEPQDDLAPVSVDEIQKHIKALKTKKAPGLDGVSNKALKGFSLPLMALLVAIFNACFKNCYFPPIWKEAVVIGLPKPGKPRDLSASYRLISLLSELGKLFEKTIKTRLSEHLIGKGLIINKQFGFRPNHSCPQQVHRLVEHISEGFKKKRKTVAVFFDVAKAFDRRAIDELTRWLRLWRIKVNPEKSAAIRFNYSKHKKKFTVPFNAPTLHIDNASIPWQHNYKYLGVTLDKHLHFRNHVARVSKLIKFCQSRLYGMIGRKSKMSLRNKRTLYLMCIRPVMTYACPVFAHAAPNIIKKLQKIQNKFCRQATDAHWCVENSVLHGDLELPTINKFMKDASKRFFDMAQNYPSPLIVSAVTYEPPPAHHFLKRPRNVLSDPPDALTSEVEKLAEAKSMQID
ncbi:Probable RNA-directed DNA polymerase from transposon BS [Eumeta japonica]|uniref:Probable RNA-directed DNA polymerase from transposon BS n=1 Tax=Eumeta variegata TaxID=151549 RepID=A0A4C1TEZ3_EUMVA|nr:Probable RNA-directed DNA polymerase from transposon BS [Eumeta japonica]